VNETHHFLICKIRITVVTRFPQKRITTNLHQEIVEINLNIARENTESGADFNRTRESSPSDFAFEGSFADIETAGNFLDCKKGGDRIILIHKSEKQGDAVDATCAASA
jgi:hypothetical protein